MNQVSKNQRYQSKVNTACFFIHSSSPYAAEGYNSYAKTTMAFAPTQPTKSLFRPAGFPSLMLGGKWIADERSPSRWLVVDGSGCDQTAVVERLRSYSLEQRPTPRTLATPAQFYRSGFCGTGVCGTAFDGIGIRDQEIDSTPSVSASHKCNACET